jgi:hypothetical protein
MGSKWLRAKRKWGCWQPKIDMPLQSQQLLRHELLTTTTSRTITTRTFHDVPNTGKSNFLELDQGHACQRHSTTIDASAMYFTSWLASHQVSAKLLQAFDSLQLEALISADVDYIYDSGGIHHKAELAVSMIVGYLYVAAHTLWYNFQLC